MLKLLVGLGNPGAQYNKTRHNAGFWFLDEVAARHRLTFRDESRFQGAVAKLDWQGYPVYLLKPQTFMNRSGQSVSALAKYFKVAPDEMLVAHDELDLPAGAIRLKQGGGHGGHNGLRDIVMSLSASNFHRLRLGIGHPGDRSQVVRFVLGEPPRDDERQIVRAINAAADLLPVLMNGDFSAAMNRLHTPSKPERLD